MNTDVASTILNSFFDWNGICGVQLPGTDISEVLEYYRHDYDEVDRLIIDLEVIGG